MALIVFRCQLTGENKPEAGVAKLGGVTRVGGVTGVGAGEAQVARESTARDVWDTGLGSSGALKQQESRSSWASREWGRQACCPEVCLCIEVAGRRVIWFILIYDTLLNQTLCHSKTMMQVFSGCFGLHLSARYEVKGNQT